MTAKYFEFQPRSSHCPVNRPMDLVTRELPLGQQSGPNRRKGDDKCGRLEVLRSKESVY
jgi:hypothetical protein